MTAYSAAHPPWLIRSAANTGAGQPTISTPSAIRRMSSDAAVGRGAIFIFLWLILIHGEKQRISFRPSDGRHPAGNAGFWLRAENRRRRPARDDWPEGIWPGRIRRLFLFKPFDQFRNGVWASFGLGAVVSGSEAVSGVELVDLLFARLDEGIDGGPVAACE